MTRERARWEDYLKVQSEELRMRRKALSELSTETKEARARLKKERRILIYKMEALSRMEKHQYDKARHQLKKVLELEPSDEQTQELLAHAERRLKEAAAQQHFEAAKKYYEVRKGWVSSPAKVGVTYVTSLPIRHWLQLLKNMFRQ